MIDIIPHGREELLISWIITVAQAQSGYQMLALQPKFHNMFRVKMGL